MSRRHDDPVWALAPRRFAVLAAGFVVAIAATPSSTGRVAASILGLAWVAATVARASVLERRARASPPRRVECPTSPAVDAAFVVITIAATGGARTLMTVGGVLAVVGGAVVSGEVASRSRHREADLRRAIDEERRAAEARLLAQARTHQEHLVLELHDGPLQLVLAARRDVLEVIAGDWINLRSTASHLADAAHDLRALSTDLYSSVLRDADLASALRHVAGAAEDLGGPPVRVSVGTGCAGFHDDLVVRAVRELLANVRKHAHARAAVVTVSATSDPPRLRVVVSDDGVGTDLQRRRRKADAGHIGLTSVERTVEAAGGALRLARRGQGTEIEIELPLGSRAANRSPG